MKRSTVSWNQAEQRFPLWFSVVLCLLTFFFLSVFSYYTSPFTTCDNGYDAAFFRLVGQGMTKGYLPYRDFFDMKGPLFFFIEYIGQLISYGRLGTFIIQWINLFFVLVIICKLFNLFNINNRILQLMLLLPVLFVASYTFEGGNLTEEFSLVPLLSCVHLCLDYLMNCDNPNELWQRRFYWVSGIWFGFCFGCLLMIRITNASLICSMILTVLIYLVYSGKIRQIAVCAGAFVVGLVVSISPAVIYYDTKGLLEEMVKAVFVLGVMYAGEKTPIQQILEALPNVRMLLVTIPCIIPILLRWRTWKERLLVLFGSLFSFFAIASGNNYTHYYTLTIPLLVIAEISIMETISQKTGKRESLAVILAVILLLSQVPVEIRYLGRAYLHLFKQDSYLERGQLVQDISSRIPPVNYNSVYCYNLSPAWYTYANLFPCIKYCGWQNHYISLMPEIYDDLEHCFATQPPIWLILPREKGELPLFLEKQLKRDYQSTYENRDYTLYQYQNP